MKKISIRKDVLLIGICDLLRDHIKRRHQVHPLYERLGDGLSSYRKNDIDAEEELASQLQAIRACNRNRFEVLVPTYEVGGDEDV